MNVYDMPRKCVAKGREVTDEDPGCRSKRHMDPTAQQDVHRFEAACRQMGKQFTEKGPTLIVGTADRLDADYVFVEGVNEVAGKHQVIISRPEKDFC